MNQLNHDFFSMINTDYCIWNCIHTQLLLLLQNVLIIFQSRYVTKRLFNENHAAVQESLSIEKKSEAIFMQLGNWNISVFVEQTELGVFVLSKKKRKRNVPFLYLFFSWVIRIRNLCSYNSHQSKPRLSNSGIICHLKTGFFSRVLWTNRAMKLAQWTAFMDP